MMPPKSYRERILDAAATALAARRDGCHHQAAHAVAQIRTIECEEAEEELDGACAQSIDLPATLASEHGRLVSLLKRAYAGGAHHE